MEDQKDISKQGYKDNSPYKDKPYLDIETQDGIIDMTNVSIPLLANNIILEPNSGLHKFDTKIVREIPLAQDGIEVDQRLGVRENYNKEGERIGESTHLMIHEKINGEWFAFPSLFQDVMAHTSNSDIIWDDWTERTEKDGWWNTYQEALRRGEVYGPFTTEEEAEKFAVDGSWKKYGGSVKQSPYDKEKFALKNQDGIIADMMRNGAFLPKFKMGAEKNIDLPDGNKYKIKKEFDKLRELPFIGVQHNDIDDRVYYDKDDKDGLGNFNIIDVAQQMYDQRREHEKTKELIKRHKKGETLSNIALKHLANLGLIDPKKIKDPIVEALNKPPPAPEPISLEELNVSKDIKNVTLDGENFVPIDDQIGMYMAHVSNKYKNTPYEKKLKRIYDKLNRVYYNDSKNSGLSIIEYMKSLSNN